MQTAWIAEYKADTLYQYRSQKEMADKALAHCDERAFFASLRADGDEHTNSIAILVKHIGGNLRSRWTDFLTSDGEKPDRQREREFVEEQADSREAIMQRWEAGWQVALTTLEALSEQDFATTVHVRGEPLSVIQAIQRNLLHTTHHVGQIDLMATVLKP